MKSDEMARIESLVQSLTNGVLMFDVNRNILLSNPPARRWTGLGVGFTLEDFLMLFKEDLSHAVKDALEKGESTHMKEASLHGSVFELVIAPVRKSTGEVVGGAITMHDITSLKDVDNMKTEFVSLVSHQLRTPLTAIRWYVEILQSGSGGPLTEKQQQFLTEVLKGSRRMSLLITDLLNIARLEGGKVRVNPEPTEIVSYVADVVEEVKPLAEKSNVELTFSKPQSAFNVSIDKSLTRQIIHNLLTNAIKYSGSGDRQGKVALNIARDDDRKGYVIEVRDNGIGIPKKWQDRIFQKFFRTDTAVAVDTEGTGLGLYLAKMIVDAFGGDISFESEEGEGTAFFVFIPASGMKKREGLQGLALNTD